jgi:LacI family transcriptional regulator
MLKMRKTSRRRVRAALLIESSRSGGRQILQGIAEYVRIHPHWSVFWREQSLHEPVPRQLAKWKANGLIARIESHKRVGQIKRLGLPTVDVLGWHPIPGVPRFGNDQEAVVRLAVDYLCQLGFQQFAYCGLAGLMFSDMRGLHFAERVRRLGYPVWLYRGPEERRPLGYAEAVTEQLFHTDSLGRWLKELPKPVGLMACNDMCAQQLLAICHDFKVRVPEEVAVIGVDNDEMLCQLSATPLSSVVLNNTKAGYEAAALLDRMIQGEKPAIEEVRMAPVGVVTRRSTETLAISEPDVAAALQFIRTRATDGITVADVLEHVALSASTLKRRFAAYVGRSPKEEMLRVQLEHAKKLLATTSLSLQEISRLAGFHQVEWLCKLFRRRTGQSPNQYRRATQRLAR